MPAETKSVCMTEVWDNFHHWRCGKPAKGKLKNGAPACGIHLRAEKAAEQKRDAYEAKVAASKDLLDSVKLVQDRLAFLGLTTRTSVGRSGGFADGTLIVNASDLMEILEMIDS